MDCDTAGAEKRKILNEFIAVTGGQLLRPPTDFCGQMLGATTAHGPLGSRQLILRCRIRPDRREYWLWGDL